MLEDVDVLHSLAVQIDDSNYIAGNLVTIGVVGIDPDRVRHFSRLQVAHTDRHAHGLLAILISGLAQLDDLDIDRSTEQLICFLTRHAICHVSYPVKDSAGAGQPPDSHTSHDHVHTDGDK